MQAGYGLDILKYTETIAAVPSTSPPNEVLRGLGYWFFYGQDRLGPWTLRLARLPPVDLADHRQLPRPDPLHRSRECWPGGGTASSPSPSCCLGVVLAVGTYPFMHPTPSAPGQDGRRRLRRSGWPLRSTNRIVPLVLLGLALLLGAGITAMTSVRRWAGLGSRGPFRRPDRRRSPTDVDGPWSPPTSTVPPPSRAYVHHAAAYIGRPESRHPGPRRSPGRTSPTPRWGSPPTRSGPDSMTRPYLIQRRPMPRRARQRRPPPGPRQVDPGRRVRPLHPGASRRPCSRRPPLRVRRPVRAVRDGPAPTAVADPEATRPPAREARPPSVGPSSLRPSSTRSPTRPSSPSPPAPPSRRRSPSSRARRPAHHPHRDAVRPPGGGRGRPGPGEGGRSGLLASNPTIFYSPTFAGDRAGLDRQLANGAVLVLTDSNQNQLSTWGTVKDNYGYVEQANESPAGLRPGRGLAPGVPRRRQRHPDGGGGRRRGVGPGHRLLQPHHQHRREPAAQRGATATPTPPGPRVRSARPPTSPSRSSWSVR